MKGGWKRPSNRFAPSKRPRQKPTSLRPAAADRNPSIGPRADGLQRSIVAEGAVVDGRRSTPPGQAGNRCTAGLNLTYESFVTDADGSSLPYYCYVGAVAMAKAPLQKFTNPLARSSRPIGSTSS